MSDNNRRNDDPREHHTLWTAAAPAEGTELISNPIPIDPIQIVADTRDKLERLSRPFKAGVRATTLNKSTG